MAAGQFGQGQDHRRADDGHASGPGIDAGAVVVSAGQHGRPSGEAQGHHRQAGVADHEPEDQVELGDVAAREQHLVDAQHHDRHAQHQPGPVAADRRLGAVHDQGQQRIEKDVDHPHHGDGDPDQQEGLRRAGVVGADPEADVVPGQVDAVDQQQGRHRHAERTEGEDGGQRYFGGRRRGRGRRRHGDPPRSATDAFGVPVGRIRSWLWGRRTPQKRATPYSAAAAAVGASPVGPISDSSADAGSRAASASRISAWRLASRV